MAANDYDPIFQAAARQYGLDPNLLKAVAQQESGFNPSVVSYQGAQGLMQMLPATAREMGASDPFDPQQAIPAAAKYLAQGLSATGSIPGALAYYHGGPDQRQWGPKTRAYVANVSAIHQKFGASAPTEAPMPDFNAEWGIDTSAPAAAAPVASAPAVDFNAEWGIGAPETPQPVLTAPTGKPGVLANAPDDGLVASQAKNIATGGIKGLGVALDPHGSASRTADYLWARARSLVTGRPVEQELAHVEALHQAQAQDQSLLGRITNALDPANVLPSAETISNPILARTGEYVPQNGPERMVQAGAQAVVGSLGPGVRGGPVPTPNPIASIVRSAPAVAGSAAVGQGVTDATGDPLIGMVASAAPGATLAATRGTMNRLVGTVSSERAQLAQAAIDRYGIPLGAGQISDSPFTRILDSVVSRTPFSGRGAVAGEQQTAFNRAIANTFGEDAPRVTTDVMARARDRIGSVFDSVAARTPQISTGAAFDQGLQQVLHEASQTLPASELAPIQNQIRNIFETVDPNTRALSGQSYQALTRRGGPLDLAMRSNDPNIRHFAGQVRDVLDDAFERSAPPEVQADLQAARSQWRNMRTVEDLVAKSPDGNLSPALLQGRVNAANKGTHGAAYGGGGDLKQLSDIGRLMVPAPSSGTAERLGIMGGMGAIGAGIQAALSTHDPLQGLYYAGVPLAAMTGARTANAVLQSPSVANALIARSLGRPVAPGLGNELLNASVPAILYQGEKAGRAELPKP